MSEKDFPNLVKYAVSSKIIIFEVRYNDGILITPEPGTIISRFLGYDWKVEHDRYYLERTYTARTALTMTSQEFEIYRRIKTV